MFQMRCKSINWLVFLCNNNSLDQHKMHEPNMSKFFKWRAEFLVDK